MLCSLKSPIVLLLLSLQIVFGQINSTVIREFYTNEHLLTLSQNDLQSIQTTKEYLEFISIVLTDHGIVSKSAQIEFYNYHRGTKMKESDLYQRNQTVRAKIYEYSLSLVHKL